MLHKLSSVGLAVLMGIAVALDPTDRAAFSSALEAYAQRASSYDLYSRPSRRLQETNAPGIWVDADIDLIVAHGPPLGLDDGISGLNRTAHRMNHAMYVAANILDVAPSQQNREHPHLQRRRAGQAWLPIVAPADALHKLLAADSLPIGGVLLDGKLHIDPERVPARCWRDESGGTGAPASRADGSTAAPPGLLCQHGAAARPLRVHNVDEMRQKAKAAASEAVGRRRGAGGGRGGAAANAGGARGLSISGGAATGTKRILTLRVKYAGQADSTAGVSEAQLRATLAGVGQLWAAQSYGRLNPVFSDNAQCVYEMTTVQVGNTDAGAVATASDAAALAHPTPACVFNAGTFDYIMYFHPGGFSYAGLGEMPGRRSWYNGGYGNEKWVVGHEAGHNWGLPHGYIWNPHSRSAVEYGDVTEIMAAARESWAGLAYQTGFKSALNWIPPGGMFETAAPTSGSAAASASSVVTLSATERASLQPGTVATARWPSPDGVPNSWVYLTHRAAYASAMSGPQLHLLSLDYDPAGTPAGSFGNRVGGPMLIDTTPFTSDQLDAEITPGGAYVLGSDTGATFGVTGNTSAIGLPLASQLMLVQPLPQVVSPAGSTDPVDVTQPVRLAWLSDAGERPEGRGCDYRAPSRGACQPAASSALRTATCGGTFAGTLTPMAPAASWVLSAPSSTPALAVTLRACGLTAGAVLGVYTSPPLAQTLHGAAVSSGAFAFSDRKFIAFGGDREYTLPCGEVLVPLTSAQPLYIAVGHASGPTAPFGWPFPASDAAFNVSLSVTCGPTQPNLKHFIYQTGGGLGGDWQGVLQQWTGDWALQNSRRAYYIMAHPFMNINKLGWQNGAWSWAWANARDQAAFNVFKTAGSNSADVTTTTGATIRYACPANMYEPASGGAEMCTACPFNTVSPAGSIGPAACVCRAGAGASTNGECAPCAAGSYKPSAGNAVCTPCGMGSTSGAGATNSLQCMTPWCSQITISGAGGGPDPNGVWNIGTGPHNGQPYYVKGGLAMFRAWWDGNYHFTGDIGVFPANGPGWYYPGLGTSTGAPPQFWTSATWGSLGSGSIICTCSAPAVLNARTGACVAPTPTPAPSCPDGQFIAGTGTAAACASCPPFQVAPSSLAPYCQCPVGYTSPGAAAACEPPKALTLSFTGAVGSAPGFLLGRYELVSDGTSASGSAFPVYALVSGSAAGSIYLTPHVARRQWSLMPAPAVAAGGASFSPRYGYADDSAWNVLGAFGSALPPLGTASTWLIYDHGGQQSWRETSLLLSVAAPSLPGPGASSASPSANPATPTRTPSPTGTPPVRVAGNLVVDLYASDYAAATRTWNNRAPASSGAASASNGDFVASGGSTSWPALATVGGVPAVVFNVSADGTADYLTSQSSWFPPGIYGSSEFTVEAWVYQGRSQDENPVLQWGPRSAPACTSAFVSMGAHPTWGAGGHWDCDLPWATSPSTAVVPQFANGWSPRPYRWHHAVWSSTGGGVTGTLSVYLNGALVTSMSGKPVNIQRNPSGVVLGAYIDTAGAVTLGASLALSRLRMHDGTLSAADVATNYAREAPLYGLALASASASAAATASITATGTATAAATLPAASASRTPSPSPSTGPPVSVAGRLLIDLYAGDFDQAGGLWVNRATDDAGAQFRVTAGTPYRTILNGHPGVQFVSSDGNDRLEAVSRDAFSGVYGSEDWSVEAWAWATGLYNENALFQWGPRLVSGCTGAGLGMGSAAVFGAFWHWDCDGNFSGGNAGDFMSANGGRAPSVGRWHHLVLTYTGSAPPSGSPPGTQPYVETLYVNGVVTSVVPDRVLFIARSVPPAVGSWTPSDIGANLVIHRLRMHDGCLTAAQVAGNFASESAVIFSASRTASPSPASQTASGTGSRTSTATSSATVSRTPSLSSSGTQTASGTGTQTVTRTSTATWTASGTATATTTETVTASGTATHTASPTASLTNTGTATTSQSVTGTQTVTPSGTGTGSVSLTSTGTASPTGSLSSTGTGTATDTPAPTRSRSVTPSRSRSLPATPSKSSPPNASPSRQATPTRTPTRGGGTRSPSVSRTLTPSRTKKPKL